MNKQKEQIYTICIHVYSANGLQSKHGKNKFFVKIGIGKTKWKSHVVDDASGNPVFNADATIGVASLDDKLKFKVVEKTKNETLGQVLVHLSDVNNQRTHIKDTVPLRSHKKCPNPFGELVFEVWTETGLDRKEMLSSVSTESLRSASSLPSGLRKIKNKLSHLQKTNSSETTSNMPRLKQSSYSCQDVSTRSNLKLPSFFVTEENKKEAPHSFKNKFSAVFHSRENLLANDSDKPKITGLSPSVVDADIGGTKVTIRGENLGTDIADITRVLLFGCDVLANLQFVSSSKIICTTVPWRPGSGHVVVETKSGGRGVSDVEFTFKREMDQQVIDEDNHYEAVDSDAAGRETILSLARSPIAPDVTKDHVGIESNERSETTTYKDMGDQIIVAKELEKDGSDLATHLYTEVLKASEYQPWNTKIFDIIEETSNEDEEEANTYESISRQVSCIINETDSIANINRSNCSDTFQDSTYYSSIAETEITKKIQDTDSKLNSANIILDYNIVNNTKLPASESVIKANYDDHVYFTGNEDTNKKEELFNLKQNEQININNFKNDSNLKENHSYITSNIQNIDQDQSQTFSNNKLKYMNNQYTSNDRSDKNKDSEMKETISSSIFRNKENKVLSTKFNPPSDINSVASNTNFDHPINFSQTWDSNSTKPEVPARKNNTNNLPINDLTVIKPKLSDMIMESKVSSESSLKNKSQLSNDITSTINSDSTKITSDNVTAKTTRIEEKQSPNVLAIDKYEVGSENLDLNIDADVGESLTPTKHPPPIGEIQPIRSASSHHMISEAPSKPPRSKQEEEAENNKKFKFDASQVDVSNKNAEISAPNKIKSLEQTIVEKERQIAELININKVLHDERSMLQGYIEAMVSRALTHCPEILCLDIKKK